MRTKNTYTSVLNLPALSTAEVQKWNGSNAYETQGKTQYLYDEYSISPIGSHASVGAVIEFRDVTEQKRIECERMNAILMTEQQSSAPAPMTYWPLKAHTI